MVCVTIKSIVLNQATDMPFVILQTKGGSSCCSLSVGPFEASAIIMAIENIKPSRPVTHDLFADFLTRHKFSLERIEIYDYVRHNYYTKLYYKKGIKHFSLEVRPSDALALAVRCHTPIFIKEELIEKRGRTGFYFDPENTIEVINNTSSL